MFLFRLSVRPASVRPARLPLYVHMYGEPTDCTTMSTLHIWGVVGWGDVVYRGWGRFHLINLCWFHLYKPEHWFHMAGVTSSQLGECMLHIAEVS